MNVWVVVPAYNEEKNLKMLLEQLTKKPLSILVVDDGSKDETFKIAKANSTHVLRNDKNLGKGFSLKRGIKFLFENKDFDYIITMDADNQHSPSDIDSFLKEAVNGEAFVIGNRMNKPLNMPQIRVLTNKFMSWLISKIIKRHVPDTQCGFRLIRKDVLKKIYIETHKFEIESEILIKAAKSNFPIKSIPIKSIYLKNQVSKIHPFLDTIRFIRFILKLKDDRA